MTRFPANPVFHFRRRVLCTALAAAFVPSIVHAQPAATAENLPVEVSAESMTGRPDRELSLMRNVEVSRGSTIITSDNATYDVVEDRVAATGHILLRRLGDMYTGESVNMQLGAGRGFIISPTYRLSRSNAQGKAQRIDFEAEDRAVVTDGTYSTCEGSDPDWYLKSSTLRLDTGRDIGNAGKTVVYFKGVPILGTPAMSFPLSEARKSGVLPPSIGTTNKGGLEITVPYYFNIAPNRDLTVYPNLIARRGLQIGADARYLSESYTGATRLEVLPHDSQTGTSRYAVTSTHLQKFAPRWSYGWNLNAASDDDYPSDFARTITTSSQRLLLRDLNLNYGGDLWRMTTRASNYQVLQDPGAPIARPYDRLPQVTLQAGRQDVQGFDWSTNAELTRFWHPDLQRGDRFVFTPELTYPILHPGYFIVPKIALDVSRYTLENRAAGMPTTLSRAVPTMSVDSGLVFQRETQFSGENTTQTLEPRLFYVHTPYRDQSGFPNFDTAEADLSFSQLFSENRFIGHDRVSDANQLTAALVSRFIDASGAERVRLALGQRFYFSEQRVTLGAVRNESRSDLLLSGMGRLTSTFSAEGNVQYSASQQALSRSNFGVHWLPKPKHILNLQYRRDLLNNLEQIDTSSQWPIADRWYGVGRINYSLPDKRVVEGLLGAEYKADCWVFRMVGQRTPTATGKATSSLFFQLELNGLTRLGSNPLDALRNSISGYQLINQP
jgi:LPS-assembly protein